ncbi:MAG: substrate-binding domain-containing protein [Burkholderiales bacterium]|nr:substrate-binding domain-containing protein [Burkholderiales bacterium]
MDATLAPLRGISSMATRHLLGELAAEFARAGGVALDLTTAGGVDAARRVREGEAFDLVFLASDALGKLAADGWVIAESCVDLVRSQVAVAVRRGAAVPSLADANAVRREVLQAATIGYSTGPSGSALIALFERWGILNDLQGKLRQAPAGVPVATLVASGEVALGFQQRSEMIGAPGIEVVGDLPPDIAIETIFSGGIGTCSTRRAEASALLAAFAGTASTACKLRNGMAPA